MSTAHPEAIYRGVGRDVAVLTPDGDLIGPLRHVVRHSPTGMAWGYPGSGPADLARSILVDALGEAATCRACQGSRRILLDASGAARPAAESDDPDAVMACDQCDVDGIRDDLPYQAYKFAHVATWGLEFRIRRSEVLAWLTAQGVSW